MKHLKTLVLAVMGALVCIACIGAGSASATKFCKNNASTLTCSEPYASETQVHSILTGSAAFEETSGTIDASCTVSTLQLRVESEGGAEATVSGPISSLTWGNNGEGCEQVTETVRSGRLEFHQIVNTDNATVTGTNTEVTFRAFGVSCIYGAGTGLDVGVLTGGQPRDARCQRTADQNWRQLPLPKRHPLESKLRSHKPETAVCHRGVVDR
jgi:hypothetical protein